MNIAILLIFFIFVIFFTRRIKKDKHRKELLTLIFAFGLVVYYNQIEKPINIKISSSGITFNHGSTKNNKTNYGRNKVTAKMKKIVASAQNWKCAMCHNTLNATYEVDHIIPLYKGGDNEMLNLQALCRNCHGTKTLNDSLN
jgi:5-methylcytosine-specific restriction enzyme A